MEITKKEFERYVKVQMSGRTNMFDITTVEALSGLSEEVIYAIMDKYADLKAKFSKAVAS